MNQSDKSRGVFEFLSFMIAGKKTKNISYGDLEDKFNMATYRERGNRAKKIWKRFLASNLSLEEYMYKLGISKVPSSHLSGAVRDDENMEVEHIHKVEVTTNEDNTGRASLETTRERVETIEDAIRLLQLDPEEFIVKDVTKSSWDVHLKVKVPIRDSKTGKLLHYVQEVERRTNHSYKFNFVRRDKRREQYYANLFDEINEYVEKIEPIKFERKGKIGVVTLADFHVGISVAESMNEHGAKMLAYNMKILVDKLNRAASIINSHNFKEVHINLLGDYFESITGLNHDDVWRDMDVSQVGSTVMHSTYRILREFFSSVTNLVCINMISGNHDRITPNKSTDTRGEGAGMLYNYLKLGLEGTGIKINYHPHLLSFVVDDIGYILTHGHNRVAKKHIASVVHENGTDADFHVWLEGHLHTRMSKTQIKKGNFKYEDVEFTVFDCMKYRKINVSSVFTGNDYSLRNGYSGISGMTITMNDGTGKCIHQMDYSLHETKERRLELSA